jgi:uridine kinase
VVAIDLITEHIRMKLQQHDLRRIYPNLEASMAAQSAACHLLYRRTANHLTVILLMPHLVSLTWQQGLEPALSCAGHANELPDSWHAHHHP